MTSETRTKTKNAGHADERINGIYANGLASCIRTIALAQPENWLAVFQNMANDAAGYVRKGGIGVPEFADRFQNAAVAYGLVDAHGQDAIQAILADALKEPTALNGNASELDHRPARSNGLRPENGSGAASALVSRCAAEITPEKIEWLWPGRLARGKHTCIAGEPGTGKSQLTIAVVAAVTTGGEWPCGEGQAPLGNVIILSAEDGAADTIIPRLLAAGADLSRVHVVSAVRNPDGSRRALNLQHDLDLLEKKIAEMGRRRLGGGRSGVVLLGENRQSQEQRSPRRTRTPERDGRAHPHCDLVRDAFLEGGSRQHDEGAASLHRQHRVHRRTASCIRGDRGRGARRPQTVTARQEQSCTSAAGAGLPLGAMPCQKVTSLRPEFCGTPSR